MADLGARVVKIERPGSGDFARDYDTRVNGLASHFVWLNRSKESISLDLKNPAAVAVLHQLLAMADVFVQNLAPGAADRMGLDWETLHALFPRLIVCDISGYGSDGPFRDKKAYDLLIQAESGFVSVTGTPDQAVKAGISIADIASGMYGYSNVLAALIQRGKTGVGSRIDLSMLECLVEWMGYALYYSWEGSAPPPRAGASHSTIYPYGPFATSDGQTVLLGLQNEREWIAFCSIVLKRPDLSDDGRYSTNAGRMAEIGTLGPLVASILSSLTSDELLKRLEAARIANARMNDMHAVWDHEQLKARGRWTTVGSPAGDIRALIPPGLDGGSVRMDAIPEVGEHTVPILRELGYSDDSIARLREQGAI